MRFPRVKAEGQGFYHCVSRVVDARFIFHTTGHGSAEAERFVFLMRRLAAFSGLQVVTYVLMSNHFHLLCEVREPKVLSELELLDRIEAGHGPARRHALEQQIARARQAPDGANQIQRLLEPYRQRMYDLSVTRGQPFTYDLFGSLGLSEFGSRGPWFVESSGPPNCCWACGIAPQFHCDSIRRDPNTM